MPRYRSLRDRLGDHLAGRPRTWINSPLRWFADRGRRGEEVPDVAWDVVTGAPWPWPPSTGAGPGSSTDVVQHLVAGGGGSLGSGDGSSPAARALDMGGGGFDTTSGGTPPTGGALTSIGGGGTDASPSGRGGGGFDLDADLGDLAILVLAVLAVLGAVLLAWFVVVPLLLLALDGLVVLVVLLSAGLVRLLFRRPWDVVAVADAAPEVQIVQRWEVRGHSRAGRVRDDVARALETGTDPALAVARVLAGEPLDDEFGSARPVTEVRRRRAASLMG
jgi:hypothetical protein